LEKYVTLHRYFKYFREFTDVIQDYNTEEEKIRVQDAVVAFKNPYEYMQRTPLVRPEKRIRLEEWPTSPPFQPHYRKGVPHCPAFQDQLLG
jgi:hypothetical protein